MAGVFFRHCLASRGAPIRAYKWNHLLCFYRFSPRSPVTSPPLPLLLSLTCTPPPPPLSCLSVAGQHHLFAQRLLSHGLPSAFCCDAGGDSAAASSFSAAQPPLAHKTSLHALPLPPPLQWLLFPSTALRPLFVAGRSIDAALLLRHAHRSFPHHLSRLAPRRVSSALQDSSVSGRSQTAPVRRRRAISPRRERCLTLQLLSFAGTLPLVPLHLVAATPFAASFISRSLLACRLSCRIRSGAFTPSHLRSCRCCFAALAARCCCCCCPSLPLSLGVSPLR